MNKKIAILTLPLHGNYGGNLQCYALCTVLQRMGHNVKVLNFEGKPKSRWKVLFSYSKRFFRLVLGKEPQTFWQKREERILNKYARDFINEYIPILKIKKEPKFFSQFNEIHFDTYIVGSDQVWRIPYAHPSIETFFFDFLKDDKSERIAYAASFGTNEEEFSKAQREDCGKLIGKFKAVSVREKSAVDLIHSYEWKCNPHLLLDPTMLLEKKDYIDLINKKEISKSNGDLFYYILDPTESKNFLINHIAQEMGLNAFTINRHYSRDINRENRFLPSIENWLRAFLDAEFVVTDSFHGCIFSILFNKPFITYGNKDRGLTRFESLLDLFDLNDRMISNSEEFLNIQMKEIDWDKINQILTHKKQESINFLINNLQ